VPDCGTVGEVLQRRAAELGLTERVLLTGPITNLAELYSAADVVVVPSWAEPFGLVIAEAMAAGRPIVASNAGAIPELIVDNVSGLLVPPRDVTALAAGVLRLLQDRELRDRLGTAGRQQVRERFTIEHYTRGMQAVLLAVATSRG
jgi:glycosyltransferase involved in cell wall biosynthesis